MKRYWKWILIPVLVIALSVGGYWLWFTAGRTFETGRCVVSDSGACIWVGEDGTLVVLHDQSEDGDLFQDLSTGDEIRFLRDDEIMESYPAQVNVYMCKKLADGSEADIRADALANLRRTGWL